MTLPFLRVYIAGPLTKGHRPANVRDAIDAAERIALRGHIPFIPHLFDIWEIIHPHNYEFWMRQDMSWLALCDVLVRLPGDSPGADREVEAAIQSGIPVFYGIQEFMESKYWSN